MKRAALGMVFGSVLLSGCTIDAALTGASLVYDHRNISESIHEKMTDLEVKEALTRDVDIKDHSDISVSIFNKLALLTGYAETKTVSDRAEKIVADYAPHHEIFNQIQVGHPPNANQNILDSLTTTKILSQLILSRSVSPSDVKVITYNNTVYLMGVVSAEEAKAAVNIAKDTSGVSRVVKVMDYLARIKSA